MRKYIFVILFLLFWALCTTIKPMEWTVAHDVLLCREMLSICINESLSGLQTPLNFARISQNVIEPMQKP